MTEYITELARAPAGVLENGQHLRLCLPEHDRKNWLFAKTPRSTKAGVIIYSIVEIAKENGLDPYDYPAYIFKSVPNLDMYNAA